MSSIFRNRQQQVSEKSEINKTSDQFNHTIKDTEDLNFDIQPEVPKQTNTTHSLRSLLWIFLFGCIIMGIVECQKIPGKQHPSSHDPLIYWVLGTNYPAYFWLISGSETHRTFEYYIKGENGEKTILEKGKCEVTTFEKMKKTNPNTVLREGAINHNNKIYYMGPVETGTYGFPVYAILVPDGKEGQVYLNDGPNQYEFIPFDHVILK